MNTKLAINIESATLRIDFIIDNPVILPVEGASIDFNWVDFIEDKEALAFLEEYDENSIWLAHITCVRYTKTECTMFVTLFESADYYRWIKLLEKEKAAN